MAYMPNLTNDVFHAEFFYDWGLLEAGVSFAVLYHWEDLCLCLCLYVFVYLWSHTHANKKGVYVYGKEKGYVYDNG